MQEHYLYEVAEDLEDSLMVVDDVGNILYANPATSVLYGQPQEAVKGNNLAEAYPDGLGDHMLRAVQAAMNNGRLVVRNLTAKLPNFSKLVDMRIHSLRSTVHKKGAIILSYEVTEREMLREQTTTIRRAAAIEMLAQKMAHELRNPLNSMGLNVELLEDELEHLPERSQEEASEIISLFRRQINRLSEIIDSYREVVKMPPLNLVETDMKKMVRDLSRFFKGEALSKGIAINIECDENVPNLWADANYIREAILNLIRNAIEAMSESGGNLTIRLKASSEAEGRNGSSEDGKVIIQVEDTGTGIEKERQKSMFDLAYTTKKNGSGLGLPLVKQIVQQHGGSINLESEPSKGSIFTLQLPCSQNSKEEIEQLGKCSISEVEQLVFGIS